MERILRALWKTAVTLVVGFFSLGALIWLFKETPMNLVWMLLGIAVIGSLFRLFYDLEGDE